MHKPGHELTSKPTHISATAALLAPPCTLRMLKRPTSVGEGVVLGPNLGAACERHARAAPPARSRKSVLSQVVPLQPAGGTNRSTGAPRSLPRAQAPLATSLQSIHPRPHSAPPRRTHAQPAAAQRATAWRLGESRQGARRAQTPPPLFRAPTDAPPPAAENGLSPAPAKGLSSPPPPPPQLMTARGAPQAAARLARAKERTCSCHLLCGRARCRLRSLDVSAERGRRIF